MLIAVLLLAPATIAGQAPSAGPSAKTATAAERSDKIYEFACHEGNRPMVGMLSAARAEDKAAEEAAKGPK